MKLIRHALTEKPKELTAKPLLIAALISVLTACSSGGSSSDDSQSDLNSDTEDTIETETPEVDDETLSELDEQLIALIDSQGLTGDPSSGRTLPDITDDKAQLGMKLFYSKSLGGNFDSACVTCHHPVLGGADDLSLSVGVDADNEDLLGEGRTHTSGQPPVPRNAPTVFNLALWDSGLFHDSRVESLGKESGVNGAASGIRTPDSSFGVADTNAGANLAAAQARFPVTSVEEMKSEHFEDGSDNDTIRAHLAARIGNYGVGAGELTTNDWLTEFQTAFGSTASAEDLITFDNIAEAISEYERSMVFVESPWAQYVAGDRDALTDQQKEGAILFLTPAQDGGTGCASCHSGDFFTDEQHHVVAFPQIGPGKGDGTSGDDDFGRERETGDADHRYQFRTPSLLNVSVTAPYGHAGSYDSLRDVVRHYNNPENRVDDYFDDGGWCQLEQFEDITGCASLYPNAQSNTNDAVTKLEEDRDNNNTLFVQNIRLNNDEVNQIVAFLEALTDPCVEDRSCLAPWIPDTSDNGPDGQQLNAVDNNGDFL